MARMSDCEEQPFEIGRHFVPERTLPAILDVITCMIARQYEVLFGYGRQVFRDQVV